jgi:large subunit ribosomal protein L35
MKTKSSVKKRFKVTASGRVKHAQAGKRHGMIKRSNKFIRQARGTTVMSDPDTKIVKLYMPYSRFIDGLTKSGIEVDRKVLSDLAIHEPDAFAAVVEKARGALAPA